MTRWQLMQALFSKGDNVVEVNTANGKVKGRLSSAMREDGSGGNFILDLQTMSGNRKVFVRLID